MVNCGIKISYALKLTIFRSPLEVNKYFLFTKIVCTHKKSVFFDIIVSVSQASINNKKIKK
jgi:hypothetical protein